MKVPAVVVVILTISTIAHADFSAYYTRLDYKDNISGKYADIVVRFSGDNKFVFCRESSYLPYWQTEKGKWYVDEIIERTGDGPSHRPDAINRYSYARLIEKNSQRVVIHWRYIPDFRNVQWDGVVDEYYTFTSDGKVLRKIKEGTGKIDDWEDTNNATIQKFLLKSDGIEQLSFEKAGLSDWAGKAITGAPVIKKAREHVVASWSFDEGLEQYKRNERDVTTEDISGQNCVIRGHKTLWKKGISGTALAFDGYYSAVVLEAENSPDIREGFVIECWAALGAYPFDWVPFVQQSVWGKNGYYLGVDERGHVGFHVFVNDKWESVATEEDLGLFRWYHIAAVFDSAGRIKVYIDGQEKVSKAVPAGSISLANNDLVIGLNSEKMPAIEGRIRKGKWPSMFGIDGLIDEVVIYNTPLSETQIQLSFQKLNPGPEKRKQVYLQQRYFPANPNGLVGEKFGAYYTKFDYYETWDNLWRVSEHPDILVEFDEIPVHIIFWRGLSSGPAFITENGKWAGDQSSENYRELDAPGEAEGCCEFMSDKQCRHSHVRIIENNDARVVIHWRYGLVDSRYFFVTDKHPEGDWADEYWTIYPDGAAVRHLARGKIWGDSWVETLFYSPPGTMPEDNIELKAYTLANMNGDVETYSWEDGSPECDLDDPIISMTNMKSVYKVFNIYPVGSSVETFPGRNKLSRFHWWNHFPVTQITSDGRSAKAADRASHSSLVWGCPSQNYLMYGFSEKPALALLGLARSWNNPPKVTEAKGFIDCGYSMEQRAYQLTAKYRKMSFTLDASEESPIFNPCFVIRNWGSAAKAELQIDGKTIESGKNLRQGIVRDTDGTQTLVVWIKSESTRPVNFIITPE